MRKYTNYKIDPKLIDIIFESGGKYLKILISELDDVWVVGKASATDDWKEYTNACGAVVYMRDKDVTKEGMSVTLFFDQEDFDDVEEGLVNEKIILIDSDEYPPLNKCLKKGTTHTQWTMSYTALVFKDRRWAFLSEFEDVHNQALVLM